MKAIINSVMGYNGLEVPFRFIKHDQLSNQLAIFLPGEGYTNSRPLFHFTEDVFINHATDVLQIDYQYRKKIYNHFSMEEICDAVKYDVNKVIESVLAEISYDQYYLIGKSLGTIGLSSVINKIEFNDAKIIWLTPLLRRDEVLEAMVQSQHSSLSFLGTNDRNYVEDRYERMIQNPNIVSSLIPQINHGMQLEADTLGSIDVLKNVIGDIESFVNRTTIKNK